MVVLPVFSFFSDACFRFTEDAWRPGGTKDNRRQAKVFVSIHRALHLICCRAFEVQKVVCAPDALDLRHPVNAYIEVV
jgi:hypothetical protein